MQNLIEHLHNRTFCTPKKEQITLQIALTLTNNPKAYGIKRAQKLQIPCFILPQSDFPTRTAFDGAMAEILSTHKIAHIFLAGFMRILTPAFTQSFSIINIHPSLLPEHKGAHGIRDSFYSSSPYGGVSVHWVNEELDSGEIIAQEKVAKYPNDTLESFEERIHACEHTLYPRAILQALRLTPCPHKLPYPQLQHSYCPL